MYSLIIGILAAVALAIFVIAMKMSDLTQGVYTRDGAEYRESVVERIRPVGQVYRSGEDKQSSAPSVEVPPEPAPVVTSMSGPQVYNSACGNCHGAGISGAPVLGDTAQWADRVAQGIETLKENAVQGFSGSFGVMPGKGGRADLSDAEVESAVDFMVSEST